MEGRACHTNLGCGDGFEKVFDYVERFSFPWPVSSFSRLAKAFTFLRSRGEEYLDLRLSDVSRYADKRCDTVEESIQAREHWICEDSIEAYIL